MCLQMSEYKSECLKKNYKSLFLEFLSSQLSLNFYLTKYSLYMCEFVTLFEFVWKLVFTDFGGSGTGYYYFFKENLTPSSIDDAANEIALGLYPNPAHDVVNVMGAEDGGQSSHQKHLNMSH